MGGEEGVGSVLAEKGTLSQSLLVHVNALECCCQRPGGVGSIRPRGAARVRLALASRVQMSKPPRTKPPQGRGQG